MPKKDEKKIYNLPVKISIKQSEKIKELTDNKNLDYRTGHDFVEQAVEKEIKYATLRANLSKPGQVYFELLWNKKLAEAYEKTYLYDKGIFPASQDREYEAFLVHKGGNPRKKDYEE